VLTLTAAWRTADMSVSASAKPSGSIAGRKTALQASIVKQSSLLLVRRVLVRFRHGHSLFSRRLGLGNKVFKSWEAADTISIIVIIAAGSAATGYVDSRCTLTRAFVCSGVVS
jgi:hypothetical protein